MPYLILDLEMSGQEAGYHDIIQIGALLADNDWKVLSKFETLVYPDNEETFSSYSEKVHGISLEDLEDAPSSYDALEDFEAWIRKTLRRDSHERLHDVVICGQSVINDINFLKATYDDLNIDWPFSFKLVDLMSISVLMFQVFENNKMATPKSYSLKSVADYFGIHRKDTTHNALEDADITFQCFKKYFELAKQAKLPTNS
ncbi:3'-5' exonuclease [Flectobacillus roseus]|uniref:3'-5' exonuclease n=1 Tax=Flectobacillus roseus TaxID=502259 RepID=A0ABT6Y7X1_9BACT|nr:3'-5' exonuclease [Flectobacillus roseus]MDI9859346.1 3'-5' exonuclease [Flectobacillus roseus]